MDELTEPKPEQEAAEAHEPESEDEESKEEKDPNRGRFLVLPLVVTEPAIGEGLGVGLVYFHRKPESAKQRLTSGRKLARTGRRQKPPPIATGVFGLKTSNGTAGVGIGHTRSFKDDKYRVTGAFAAAEIKAKYYLGDLPFRFAIDGDMFFLNAKRRIGDSNTLLGLSTSYVDASATFQAEPNDPPSRGLNDFDFTDVGIAATASYDTRDDSMMPASGQLYDLAIWRYDEGIGGDFDYWTARLKANWFHTLGEKFVMGYRFEIGSADGDVPFYAAPFVPLRGIPALRYQGDTAGVVEVEGRYQFAERWAGVAFAGTGFVDSRSGFDDTDDDIYGYGIGVRFLALKEQNIWLGLDLARGPEEDAYYIQVAHPW